MRTRWIALAVTILSVACDARVNYKSFSRLLNPSRYFKGHLSAGYAWNVSYFSQNLDHFSFTNTSYHKFQQKYIFWLDYWSGSHAEGPIFVYCGNEGPIDWFVNNAGFIRESAEEFGAMIVAPEHRYYGESMPFGSQEASYKNSETLAYLTTEQAMADYAILLTDLKRNYSAENSPVVLFGGSYGGMIAAWFRLKYPHISVGAVASSAPILQFGDIVPSDTFYKIASQDFRSESETCFQAINSSWDQIFELGSTHDGLVKLSTKFGFCRPLTDVSQLSDWLSSAFAYLAMVDYPIRVDFLMPLPAHPVRKVCEAIDSLPPTASIIDRIAVGANVYYNFSGDVHCFEVDEDPHGMGGWDYQYCTEMTMPMSSNPANSMFYPFSWNLTEVESECLGEFGVRPRPDWVLTHFGGQDVKSVLRDFGSNIVFSNGARDPWSGGGVLEDINPSIVATVIPDGAHHFDLRASTPFDPPSVTEQRKFERREIRKWLLQHQNRHSRASNRHRQSMASKLLVTALPLVLLSILALLLLRSRVPGTPPSNPAPSLLSFSKPLTLPLVLLTLAFPLLSLAGSSALGGSDSLQKADFLPVDLKLSNFNATLKAAGEPWTVVEFYASWCPHCQHYRPHYEKVASLFNGAAAPYPTFILFARVDCAVEAELCARFSVQMYPTLLLGPPSAVAMAKSEAGKLPDGIEALALHSFTDTELLALLITRFERQFDLGAARTVQQGQQNVEIRKLGRQQGLRSRKQDSWPTGAARASLHDIEEATALAFKYSFDSAELTPESRQAMDTWLNLIATHHPSARCRRGGAMLLSELDDLWPTLGASSPKPANRTALKLAHVCGPHSPKHYWVDCKGSSPNTRGYSCGLWRLFHSLTVRVGQSEGSVALQGVRMFVQHFFGCTKCRGHFLRMANRLKMEEAKSREEAILWLWEAHNVVNDRLAKEEEVESTGDPEFHKVQWPTQQQCPSCHVSAGMVGWNESAVVAFLTEFYGSPREVRVGRAGRRTGAAGLFVLAAVLGAVLLTALLCGRAAGKRHRKFAGQAEGGDTFRHSPL